MLRFAKLLFLLLGVALLAVVLLKTDMHALWPQVERLGLAGMTTVMVVYALYFFADALSWHIVLPAVPLKLRWLARTFAVRMVGEAYNNITPMASMGGEPVKAWLLNIRPPSSAGAAMAATAVASITGAAIHSASMVAAPSAVTMLSGFMSAARSMLRPRRHCPAMDPASTLPLASSTPEPANITKAVTSSRERGTWPSVRAFEILRLEAGRLRFWASAMAVNAAPNRSLAMVPRQARDLSPIKPAFRAVFLPRGAGQQKGAPQAP